MDTGQRFRSVTPNVTRRRFMQMAILATSSVALPLPKLWASEAAAVGAGRYCTPGASGTDPGTFPPAPSFTKIEAPSDGNWSGTPWPFGGTGHAPDNHFDDAPRAGYIMVHHSGYPNAHLEENSCEVCSAYDFCIDRAGDICSSGRWDDSSGAHAYGCNCKATGVMLYGCFGGCTSGNVPGPSDAQLCSLAYLSLHLGTPDGLWSHRPHRRCSYWNPCDVSNPTVTVCPGTYLATGDASDGNKWTDTGEALINKMLVYRSRLARGCACYWEQTCP